MAQQAYIITIEENDDEDTDPYQVASMIQQQLSVLFEPGTMKVQPWSQHQDNFTSPPQNALEYPQL